METISSFCFFYNLILTWNQSFSAIWLSLPEKSWFLCDSNWRVQWDLLPDKLICPHLLQRKEFGNFSSKEMEKQTPQRIAVKIHCLHKSSEHPQMSNLKQYRCLSVKLCFLCFKQWYRILKNQKLHVQRLMSGSATEVKQNFYYHLHQTYQNRIKRYFLNIDQDTLSSRYGVVPN